MLAAAAAGLLAIGAATTVAAPAVAVEEGTILALANSARASHGLGPLQMHGGLSSVALSWASHMAATGQLAHNPNYAGQIPGGWTRAGENVAMGYPSAQRLHNGWMNSPGHRANILGDFTHIGIAHIQANGNWWSVQVFAKYGAPPAPPAPPPPPPAPPAPAPPPSVPEPRTAPQPGSPSNPGAPSTPQPDSGGDAGTETDAAAPGSGDSTAGPSDGPAETAADPDSVSASRAEPERPAQSLAVSAPSTVIGLSAMTGEPVSRSALAGGPAESFGAQAAVGGIDVARLVVVFVVIAIAIVGVQWHRIEPALARGSHKR